MRSASSTRAAFAAQVPRSPVDLAQAVEHRAPNAELGVGAELHVLGAVKLIQSIDEADHRLCTHQILEVQAGQPAGA